MSYLMPDELKIQHPDSFFIGGKWVKASTDRKIDLVNPATEEVFARVADPAEADMDKAVAAARDAFDNGPWPFMDPKERAVYIRRYADELRKRAVELGWAWTAQMGAIAQLTAVYGASPVSLFDQYADMAETYQFEKVTQRQYGGIGVTVQEPVGVVAAIVPWNAPFGLASAKIAAALAAGCTIVFKPSPETPLEAYIMAEAAEAAGLPPGVLNMLPAGREVGDRLVRNPGIDKVSFTGSTAVGKHIAAVCAERVARVGLELGGKSAAIILDDIAIEKVLPTLIPASTLNCGQACAALTRVVVSRKRHDAFVEALAATFNSIVVGDPFDQKTQMGPLAMKRQYERVLSYIEKGRSEATLAAGGNRPADLKRGYYVEPTVFANVDNSAAIAQEEIFGPVVSVIPYDTEADAIRIANDSPFGLNGSVFTEDLEKAYYVGRRIRAGNFTMNDWAVDNHLPFGGFKQSGIGRQNGVEGLEEYLETKVIFLPEAPKHLK
jgi:acyl-CoA reductase-like NAD-dependent aldehyde dehydrogenase